MAGHIFSSENPKIDVSSSSIDVQVREITYYYRRGPGLCGWIPFFFIFKGQIANKTPGNTGIGAEKIMNALKKGFREFDPLPLIRRRKGSEEEGSQKSGIKRSTP